jgi:hypothetical protein
MIVLGGLRLDARGGRGFVSQPGAPWEHGVTGFGDHVADE